MKKINIKDYTWDGQSRKINVKKHQKRVGVGFLFKKYLYTCYYIECMDHKYEGILYR